MSDTTPKWGLHYSEGSDQILTVDDTMQALAEDLDDLLTPWDSGAFASRPVSTPGSPGKAGRRYYATDTGVEFVDTGTGWAGLEPIHLVGGVGEPAFTNSWSDGSASLGAIPASFYRQDGRIYLQGVAKHNTGSAASPFTLPAGYRPLATAFFACPVAAGSAASWVSISAAGVVTPGASALWIFLDGVSFCAA